MAIADTALHLDDIRRLVEDTEPCVSVYLNLVAPQTTDIAEDLALRWRAAAAQLREQGADEPSIDATGRHLAAEPPAPGVYAVVAAQGQIRFGQALPGLAMDDMARYGAPADVVGLLAWLQAHPPYLLAVTDRTGADVTAVARGAADGTTSTVTGPGKQIERNAPGGWSQPRYQHRAEDSWQHNAKAVADAVTRALDDVNGRLLLVAGDVRAAQLLENALDTDRRPQLTVRHLPGGRSPDGSTDTRQAAMEQAITEFVADDTAALLDRFMDQTSSGGARVEGVGATLAALAEGRIGTLLIANDPEDQRVAWYGPQTLCAEIAESVPEEGPLAAGRLPDVAVRAALLTGAQVRVLSPQTAGSLGDRIGGLGRYTTTAAPEEQQ